MTATVERMSLRLSVCKSLARNLFLGTLLVLSVLTMRAVVGDVVAVPAPAVAAPGSVKTPEALELVAEHDCWTGEAPADMQGVLPGHVVVTVDGATRYAGERMVGKALGQIFEGVDHELVVHGFCR